MSSTLCFQNEEFDCNDLHKGTLNLPYLFSLETDEGVDIMKVKSSLDKLYATVYPDCKLKLSIDNQKCFNAVYDFFFKYALNFSFKALLS